MRDSVSEFTISAVEREVGLSKDVLRVWERRYGFPSPRRDGNGERLYPLDQVRRLRLVKRLMDRGMRPGRLVRGSLEELENLAAGAVQGAPAAAGAEAQADPAELLDCLRVRDASGLHGTLKRRLAQRGLAAFVQDTIAPFAMQVGDAWARGELEVYEEHLFTEVASRLLRQAILDLPAGPGPVVLLTTVPDEAHGLGLLMGEAMLSLRGARCINLGTQVPLMDIARAAGVYSVEIVALSFSSGFAARRIPEQLRRLRESLPDPVRLWACGAAVRRSLAVEGVRMLASMEEALSALDDASLPAAEARESGKG